VVSKFEKQHGSRLPHPPYSPDIRPATLALGMRKGVLKDREFNSSDEIEEKITTVWDEFTFDEVQSVFHN
jgi:hypothetical protein